MPKPLVIVESPAKAKTIAGFLGHDYVVEASIGHIRDLPSVAAEIPAAYKGEPWARLGVDVDNDFKPLYVVPGKKKEQVRKLKGLAKDASEVYLATDEDREGESIAWHLLEVLAPRVPVKRMVFHEITRPAIERAVREWRELDRRLVDAQEARRILDRLYGYEVSPVLWKKVMNGLSAGRVQSVATRLLVERERARMRFTSAGYWAVDGQFQKGEKGDRFGATLVSLDSRRLATGKDFDENGRVSGTSGVLVLDEATATGLAGRLVDAAFSVRSVEEKPYRRSPYPPFMTSTLQQEAGRKLRFGSQRTMRVAQDLYEQGYITYMRTDSTTLSDQALVGARAQAAALYGPEYVPAQPRRYDKKVKNAQEAHEAIRPSGETFRTPEQTGLAGDMFRLYDLIWKRTVASQMADARGQSVQVRLGARSSEGEDAEFATSGKTIEFPGFLRAYVEGSDDPNAALEDQEIRLPVLAVGDPLQASDLEARGHATQPPARYTEASLVKALEELGVGRPSTYASIIENIQARGYVWKRGSALVPAWTAFAVIGLLEQHFGELVDYGFTAQMEEELDEIARGQEEAVPWLTRFYFGGPGSHEALADRTGAGGDGIGAGLKQLVHEQLGEIDAREINSIPIGDDIVVRVGRYGPYIQRGEDRAPVPEDLAPDELTVERAEELLGAGSSERVIGVDPASGQPVMARAGRFGPYVQLGEGNGTKPKTQSLLAGMALETVTLEQALQLLSLPRVLGADTDGEVIEATHGRYGPYLKKGADSRSLEGDAQLFTVTLEEARALFAQPKPGRGARAAAALRDLGPDPVSGQAISVKEGRFGPYVTDGVTNASLRKGDTVEGVTLERAAELLAARREAAPVKRGAAKRSAGARKASPAAKKAAPTKKAGTGAKKVAGAKKAAGVKKAAGAKKAATSTKKTVPATNAAVKKTTAKKGRAAG
ncbi:MAG TPA: type I DNA topoisomerase [Acidimicrobiales bacterium]|nr:type I DNA topoisomerase [Acidimicrobiales bacterium]